MKKLIYGLIITFIVCFSGFLFNVDVAYASEVDCDISTSNHIRFIKTN